MKMSKATVVSMLPGDKGLVLTDDGEFAIEDRLEHGTEVTVRYHPQDQFATVLPEAALHLGDDFATME